MLLCWCWLRWSRSGGGSGATIGRNVNTVEDAAGERISAAKGRELTFERSDAVLSRELVRLGVRRVDSEHELAAGVLVGVSTMPFVDAIAHFGAGKIAGNFAASW